MSTQWTVPTVRIAHPHVPDGVEINASDFDEAKHRRFVAPKPDAPAAKGEVRTPPTRRDRE